MNLLIVRHAIAMERDEFVGPDDRRPLTDEGIKKMKKNAKGLAEIVRRPDLIVTSPLTRAQQTKDLLLEVWPGAESAVCEALRPETDFDSLVKWLKAKTPAHPDTLVVLVGHEPHLSSLISWFLDGSTRSFLELKKGGACLLEFPMAAEKAKARMLWHLPPAVLKQLRD